MTRLWTTLALSLAATSPALAQSSPSTTTNDDNQAGPTETNTNAGGISREGNVQDRNGTDTTNPSDATAPQNAQTPPTTYQTPNPSPVPEPTTNPDTQAGYVVASTRETTYVQEHQRERAGITLAVGAGTSGFTGSTLRGTTNMGGDWDVRLTLGTRSPLAIEGSYIGSAQSISALGLNNNTMLYSNGVQGDLRLNATIDLPVQPFVYAGAAWRRYNLNNSAANTSDVASTDNVVEFPAGVGLAAKVNGFVFDARGEYRYARDANLVRNNVSATDTSVTVSDTGFGAMNRWGVNASVGYEF